MVSLLTCLACSLGFALFVRALPRVQDIEHKPFNCWTCLCGWGGLVYSAIATDYSLSAGELVRLFALNLLLGFAAAIVPKWLFPIVPSVVIQGEVKVKPTAPTVWHDNKEPWPGPGV